MGLDSLGVTTAEQGLYEVLLRHPEGTMAELTELTRIGQRRLRGLLKSLEDKGMVIRSPGRPSRFSPSPPDIAVEVLALRRQEEIARARLVGAALVSRIRQENPPAGELPVEVVRGRQAVAQRFRQIQQMARQELAILDKPPYVVDPDGAQHLLQREVQSRGVRYRTIYDRDALASAGRVEKMRQLAASGEDARVLAGVPMKLVIADRRIGLVPHELPNEDETVVLLRSSALLDGLITLFDTLWERATPLWPDAPSDAWSTNDQQLLALLAAGLTDQAIARKLGVALRTVERRVRRVMDGLGARTRFQAGLQAAIRGLFRADDGDGQVSHRQG